MAARIMRHLSTRSTSLMSLSARPHKPTADLSRQHHHVRPASTSSSTTPKPVKARVLEQPDKFRAPSHPAKLRKTRPTYSVPLSERERAAQTTRSYPHMMPRQGTFMHWFLSSRLLHTWISLSILMSLAFYVVLNNFIATTIYKDQLPPNSLFSSHPIRFVRRYWDVYKMHTVHVSAETAERRRNNVEDVRKRSEYRKAHGQEDDNGAFGGWTAKTDDEVKGSGMREGPGSGMLVPGTAGLSVPGVPSQSTPTVYVAEQSSEDSMSIERPKPVKKWLGIW